MVYSCTSSLYIYIYIYIERERERDTIVARAFVAVQKVQMEESPRRNG